MAVIGKRNAPRYEDEGFDVILTVDGIVAGAITLGPNESYVAQTKGIVPAIDGISAATVEQVWEKIRILVYDGKVVTVRPITLLEC